MYLYDVDVYEDEPIRGRGADDGLGALCGVGVSACSPGRDGHRRRRRRGSAHPDVLVRGVLLPASRRGAWSRGRFVLLRYRRFNDVLDGATFGAASAVSFVGAEVITFGVSLLRAGAHPDGDTLPWVMRILTIAVTTPVLVMAAIAAACAAFWLRYRGPARDRGSLGPLGRPALATLAACLVSVVAGVSLVLLRDLPRLVVLGGLTLLALAWLRHLLDLGLREEAVEAATGEEQECQGCHRLFAPASSSAPGAASACGRCPSVLARGRGRRRAMASRPGSRGRDHSSSSASAWSSSWPVRCWSCSCSRPSCGHPARTPHSPAPPRWRRSRHPQDPCWDRQAARSSVSGRKTQTMDGGDWQLDFDPRWWFLDTTEPGAVWLSTTWVAATVRGDTARSPSRCASRSCLWPWPRASR